MGLATVGCTKEDEGNAIASEKVNEAVLSKDKPVLDYITLYESFDFLVLMKYDGAMSFGCFNRVNGDWNLANYNYSAYKYAAYSVGKVTDISEIRIKYNSEIEMQIMGIPFSYDRLSLVENGGYVFFHDTDNGKRYIRIWLKSYTIDSNLGSVSSIRVQYQVF